ncbi:MAG: type I pantothenate kinase, partial [Actinomycetes bacterium]
SPFVVLDRPSWSALRESTPLTLTEDDVRQVQGLGDPLDLREVEEVYLPLSRLLNLQVAASQGLHEATATFLGERHGAGERVPYVIGVAGSVAVGKSATARLLRLLLSRWPDHPRVELVTTDGFLLPNAELEQRGLMARKGFPESYDQRALRRFVAAVKSGAEVVRAPVYSHLTYDIVPDECVEVRRPDILVLEGLNVLAPPRPRANGRLGASVSDYFDFSVYVDAKVEDIRSWYISRFLRLRETAFQDPSSYFHRYATLTDEAAVARAESLWRDINEVNLVENILPTRERARVVLQKSADHSVQRVLLRKV